MNKRWFLDGANLNRGAQLVVVLVAALSLKQFYSTASVDELRWILAPTTFLVELITGKQFAFEARAGYMSSDHRFLIAASCAGVNFLLTAFLMLSLSRIWKGVSRSWWFIPGCLVAAYGATLIANTIRIAVALKLQGVSRSGAWLDAGEIHRVEGIVVYFASLLVLFLVSERSGSIRERLSVMASESPATVVRKLVFPLFIYYATTLAMPFLNGAFRNAGFWQHAVFVMPVPLVVWVAFAVVALASRLVSTETR